MNDLGYAMSYVIPRYVDPPSGGYLRGMIEILGVTTATGPAIFDDEDPDWADKDAPWNVIQTVGVGTLPAELITVQVPTWHRAIFDPALQRPRAGLQGPGAGPRR